MMSHPVPQCQQVYKQNKPVCNQHNGEALTITEAAQRLHASTRTVYRMINSGELKAYRLGKRATIRIKACDIDAALTPIKTVADVLGQVA